MEEIEIYSSKIKSFLLLIGSIIFVVGGIYFFIYPENFTGYRGRSPIFIKIIGVASILFFGLGIYVAIRQLIKNKLILVIDKTGLNVNPNKDEKIEWKNIEGFSEIKIHSTKIVIININNSDYWIEKEQNKIRKNMMKFNVSNYGSPFNLSANSMSINNEKLLKILTESLQKYKYSA